MLEGQLVAAQAAARGELPSLDALRTTVRDSVAEALAPTPPIAMEGALEATFRPLGADKWEVKVRVHLDHAAWAAAEVDTPGVAPFRVSSARRETEVPVEIVIDAPGMAVDTPTRSLARNPSTTGGREEWTVNLRGAPRGKQPVWVSLYSVGRFVQAVAAVRKT